MYYYRTIGWSDILRTLLSVFKSGAFMAPRFHMPAPLILELMLSQPIFPPCASFPCCTTQDPQTRAPERKHRCVSSLGRVHECTPFLCNFLQPERPGHDAAVLATCVSCTVEPD
jgi:hypothetical protein